MHILDKAKLPENYPTHRHAAAFWEALGRLVGTYGFLEEVLGKAIFALTGTREYTDAEIDTALERWKGTLKRALSDSLGSLITSYGDAVRNNEKASVPQLEELI